MNDSFLNQYDVIIFDCDGVLIDINLLKCEAFGAAVEGYPPDIVEKFVDHCKKTFGISRYVKFKEFLRDFARESFHEEKFNMLVNNYADVCQKIYLNADITPGTEQLLSYLYNQDKKIYVASGSDEAELNHVFTIRNLSKYFNGVYGSPKTKLECATNILNNHPNKKGVFIGDAISDMKTARELGLDFIYMSKYTVQSEEQDSLCKSGAQLVISTLDDLMQVTLNPL
jgi:phosphoglycolate phosphatase-like HAD superfamily hydrolase